MKIPEQRCDGSVSESGRRPMPLIPGKLLPLPPPPLLPQSDGHIPRYLSPRRSPHLTAKQRGRSPGRHGKKPADTLPGSLRAPGVRSDSGPGQTVPCGAPADRSVSVGSVTIASMAADPLIVSLRPLFGVAGGLASLQAAGIRLPTFVERRWL